MGRRMSVLRRLSCKAARRVLLVSPESLVQRVPPSDAVAVTFEITTGKPLARDALVAFAEAAGYIAHDRVDEPGESALQGEVVDVYPADAPLPVRILVDAEGMVTDLRTYDPLSQRTDGAVASLTLGAASELVLGDDGGAPRQPGIEHRMAAHYGTMRSLFDIVPKAATSHDPLFDERMAEALAQVADAFEAQRMLHAPGDAPTPEPHGLYLDADEVAAGLAAWTSEPLALADVSGVPSVAGTRNPGRAFCDLVEAQLEAGRRVVLAGLSHERRALARALGRGLHLTPTEVGGWSEVLAAEPGAVVSLDLDIDAGFVDPDHGHRRHRPFGRLGRSAREPRLRRRSRLAGGGTRPAPRRRGAARGSRHRRAARAGDGRDRWRDPRHPAPRIPRRRLVLAPIGEIDRIWRYGAEEAAVTLDRLNGEAWPRRRAEVSRHMDEAAARLVELAKARAAAVCEPITPPTPAYPRFAARFGYPETPDQAAAIAAVLSDLASGRPMDRMVCGDVGFGKTEVALRAAAAVALSGRQVALCAPTTVLAKQHFQTFQRRFAGTGIKVEQLSRLVASRDAKAVRESIAAGEADIVIGTHALAGEQVAFADLGLMIVDEEQKFGAAVKQRLRDLASGGHLLSMTATPIPRTLQAAMIGVQDVSVIASPPARRRPIRTFLAPFERGQRPNGAASGTPPGWSELPGRPQDRGHRASGGATGDPRARAVGEGGATADCRPTRSTA